MWRFICAVCAAMALSLVGDGRPQPPPPTRYVRCDVFLPHDRALIIGEHLERIVASGWGIIGPGELYHGHILLVPQADRIDYFNSIGQLMSYSPGVLYHSDEMLNRWWGSEGTLPPLCRHPRSIIGYWDGTIAPASSLLSDAVGTAKDFQKFGTIHEGDLKREFPERFSEYRHRKFVVGNGMCATHLQFDITFGVIPEPVITVNQKYYTVSLPCIAP